MKQGIKWTNLSKTYFQQGKPSQTPVISPCCFARWDELSPWYHWVRSSIKSVRISGSLIPFKMATRLDVDIAIESLLESEVEEISRDGQEKYVP